MKLNVPVWVTAPVQIVNDLVDFRHGLFVSARALFLTSASASITDVECFGYMAACQSCENICLICFQSWRREGEFVTSPPAVRGLGVISYLSEEVRTCGTSLKSIVKVSANLKYMLNPILVSAISGETLVHPMLIRSFPSLLVLADANSGTILTFKLPVRIVSSEIVTPNTIN